MCFSISGFGIFFDLGPTLPIIGYKVTFLIDARIVNGCTGLVGQVVATVPRIAAIEHVVSCNEMHLLCARKRGCVQITGFFKFCFRRVIVPLWKMFSADRLDLSGKISLSGVTAGHIPKARVVVNGAVDLVEKTSVEPHFF